MDLPSTPIVAAMAEAAGDAAADALVPVFDLRATQEARQTRPALFRARMAWSEQNLRARAAAQGPQMVGGMRVGDAILAEVRPGAYARGIIIAWERAGSGAGPLVQTQTLARIRLDDEPGAARFLPRWKLRPAPPDRPLDLAAAFDDPLGIRP